jgi:L-lactate dehydrogenase complex protein LldE
MDTPRRVALFVTCIVDQLMPEVGVATVKLLRRAGCEVAFPSQQTCCGQPFFNSGFRKQAQKLAMRSIEIFENEERVILPSGSCTSMIRAEYPDLLADHHGWTQRAERLAAKTFELSEFLVHQTHWTPQPGLSPREESAKGSSTPSAESMKDAAPPADPMRPAVTYHDSCHMCRHLKLKEEPRQLLKDAGIPLHEMTESDRCCGFGGLFSLRMPEVSSAMTAEKLRLAADSGAKTIVTADPGCLMQMRQLSAGTGLEINHLAVILEEATR